MHLQEGKNLLKKADCLNTQVGVTFTEHRVILKNISYKYIQERLGHKSLDITLNVYGHLSDARRNSENDKLTRLYGNEFLLETTSKL